MKVTLFEIHLDNSQGVFEAGNNVSGYVALNLAKPMKMRSIKITFEGKAKAAWEVHTSNKSKTKYRGHENYLNSQVILFSSGSQTSQVHHPAGSHVYPFSFPLPTSIPSSFEGSRGYVRYFMRACIERPWKFDEQTKRAFTVIHHYDLNHQPNAIIPISCQETKEIEGCCCNDGTVVVSLHLPKSGYVPGEPIIYDILVDNKSDNTINEITLDLKQTVTYSGTSDSLFSSGNPKYHDKVQTFTLFREDLSLRKNNTANLHRATFVPSLPPSQLEGCGIININYSVLLKIPSGWGSVKLERQILLGTKPLREPEFTPPSAPAVSGVGFLGSGEVPVVMPTAPPQYEDIVGPPPSYAECVFGRTDIRDEEDTEHTGGDTNWAPAYPYYNWSQHSTQTYGGAAPTTARLNPPDYNQI